MAATALEAGGVLRAEAPDFHVWADARIRVEEQEPFPHSYDGQYIEPSEEGQSSRATFTSFARFEGRMTLDTRLGRLGAGRGSQHWGPTYLYPLVLGQWSQPYSHADWTMTWGDIHLRTLWGQLAIDGAGAVRDHTKPRTLYAHRYEWTPHPSISLGATEALILYETSEPIAFVPIVPLFMLKSQSVEHQANGELALDASFRPLDGLRMYGEFLVDDMSEPTSLFDDFWKNRWAWTLGAQLATRIGPAVEAGIVAEASRVEPWVYTQYVPNTCQASTQGIPLGHPNGPNSFSVAGTPYLTYGNASLFAGLEWVEKGIDTGSSIQDTLPESSRVTKEFLASSRSYLRFTGGASYATSRFDLWLRFAWGSRDDFPTSPRQPARWELGGMVKL